MTPRSTLCALRNTDADSGIRPGCGNPARQSPPTAEQARSALGRILASTAFRRSRRASDFLRYVVEETLAGRGRRLKALTIAIDVYERPADHNIHSDPTVRVEASRVRTRLDQYYASEGQHEPIRIRLKRGSYVPSFGWAESKASQQPEAAEQAVTHTTHSAAARSNPVGAAARPTFARTTSLPGLARAALGIAAGALLLAAVAWATTPASTNDARLAAGTDATGKALSGPDGFTATSPAEFAATYPFLVMPVEAIGNSESNQAYAAGLSDSLRTSLDPLHASLAKSGLAAHDAQNGPAPTDEAATARFVLRSSVRTSGTKRRLVLRLVDTQTGRQVWARQIEQPLRGEPRVNQALMAARAASLFGNDSRKVLLSAADAVPGPFDALTRAPAPEILAPSASLSGIVARLR